MASLSPVGCVTVALLWVCVLGVPTPTLESRTPFDWCYEVSQSIHKDTFSLFNKYRAERRFDEELYGGILEGPVSLVIDDCNKDSFKMDPQYTKCLQNIQITLHTISRELNQLEQIKETGAHEVDSIARDIKGLLSGVKKQLKMPWLPLGKPGEVVRTAPRIRGNSWTSEMATLRVLKLSVLHAQAVYRSFGILVSFDSIEHSRKSLGTE